VEFDDLLLNLSVFQFPITEICAGVHKGGTVSGPAKYFDHIATSVDVIIHPLRNFGSYSPRFCGQFVVKWKGLVL